MAGKRKGKEDERHLWPEMLRAIKEIQPRWVVGENVYGLVNWSGGLVFHEVQADLEAAGYKVFPYVLPAASVNAPHRRDRIWFVAYATGNGYKNRCKTTRGEERSSEQRGMQQFEGMGGERTTPHPNRNPTGTSGEGASIEGIGFSNDVQQSERGSKTELNNRPSSVPRDVANRESQSSRWKLQQQQAERESGGCNSKQNAADTNGTRIQRQSTNTRASKTYGQRWESFTKIRDFGHIGDWSQFPTQSPVRFGDDGLFTKSHGVAISNERNSMDRNLVTKLCLDEGRLKVDFNVGKIYSLKQRGKEGQEIELHGSDCNGYIVHGIRYNGFKIQLRAHQIVWIAANGLYDKKTLMIDHINRNKKDNRLANLRLVDAKGNRENATEYKGKLTEEQKDMMVWLHKEDGIPMRELAEDFDISKSRVQQIISEHSGLYGITFSKWRNESIKAAGNAIVPQVALQIFKTIQQYENLNN